MQAAMTLQPTEPRYLTEADVERITKISRRTLQKWRLRSEGPPFQKINRMIRYEHSAVIAWMRERGRA